MSSHNDSKASVSRQNNGVGITAIKVMAIASLGGILYGFDIGIISGALLYMKQDLALSPSEMSLIVAAVLGGGSFATLIGGSLADRFGRKTILLTSGIIFIVGIVAINFATNFEITLLSRLVQGIGTGLIIVVVPLYIAELIPPRIRGRGVTLFQLCVTLGILLGYLVNYGFRGTGDWRAMFETALVPGLLFLIGGFTLPRSPRWLYRRGHRTLARELLQKIYPADEAEQTFQALEAGASQNRVETSGWRLLLRAGYRKAFFIALAVGILNQLTGINTLLQFNTLILHQSGLNSSATAALGSVGIGITNFCVTVIALILVDRVGRKPLLVAGTLGATLSLLFIGVVHALTGPSPFQGYATLAGLITFVIFFAVGPGVVVWLVISEIMPLAIRAKGMAISLFANSMASAGLAAIFMNMVGSLGYSGSFLLLALFVFIYLLIAIFPLPETKDRSLEDIERHFLSRADLSRADETSDV